MAEVTKFNERNVAIYSTIESTPGTYVAPAASDATPVTALTGSVIYETNAFKYLGDNLSRDEYTYIKDSYADVSVDTFMQILGTLNTSLAVNSAPLSELYQACGGAVTVLSTATYGYVAGAVIIDNTNASDTTLSMDFRKTSIQDVNNNKLWKFTYIRGMVDITANVSEVPMQKFTLKGNATIPQINPVLVPVFGVQTTNVAPAIRKQNIVSTVIAPTIAINSIAFSTTTATVTSPGHGYTTGDSVEITGVKGVDGAKYNGTFTITVTGTDTFTYTMTGTPSAAATGAPMAANKTRSQTFNFTTLNAANFFGFDFQRYLTSTEEGFSKDAIPTDVTIGMLENQSMSMPVTVAASGTTTATVTLPANHGLAATSLVVIATGNAALDGQFTLTVSGNSGTYTLSAAATASVSGTLTNLTASAAFDPDVNISKFFSVWIKFGTGAGRYVTYKWNKLQLANVKEGKVANLFSRECTFRNTGKSFIILE